MADGTATEMVSFLRRLVALRNDILRPVISRGWKTREALDPWAGVDPAGLSYVAVDFWTEIDLTSEVTRVWYVTLTFANDRWSASARVEEVGPIETTARLELRRPPQESFGDAAKDAEEQLLAIFAHDAEALAGSPQSG